MIVTTDNLPIIFGRLVKVVQNHNSVRVQHFHTRSLKTANQLRVKAADSHLYNDLKNGSRKILASQPQVLPVLCGVDIRPDYKRTIGKTFHAGIQLWAKYTLILIGDFGWIFILKEGDKIMFHDSQVIVQTIHDDVTKEKFIKFFEFR